MTRAEDFLQITALLVGIATMFIVLSTQTYDQRPRFRDAPGQVVTPSRLDVSSPRGTHVAGQGGAAPLTIAAGRARN